MDISNALTREARERGFSLREPDEHTRELIYHGKRIAVFSQSGATIENIYDAVREGDVRCQN